LRFLRLETHRICGRISVEAAERLEAVSRRSLEIYSAKFKIRARLYDSRMYFSGVVGSPSYFLSWPRFGGAVFLTGARIRSKELLQPIQQRNQRDKNGADQYR